MHRRFRWPTFAWVIFLAGYACWGSLLWSGSAAAPVTPPAVAEQKREVPTSVRVAAIQFAADFGEAAANREALAALVREAAAGGAKIIVLPEASIPGYISSDHRVNWHVSGRPLEKAYRGRDPGEVAELVPGPSTELFAALAKELGIYVTVPLIEKVDDDPVYFNTVCLMSPQGEIAAHYRKLHPYPPTEKSWANDGDRGLQTFDTEFGRVGFAICYDIHFVLEDYAKQDVWALLFSTAWVDREHPATWFWQELPEKVAGLDFHLIAANWSSTEKPRWRGFGFSEVIRRDGKVLACAHTLTDAEIVYADLPTSPVQGD